MNLKSSVVLVLLGWLLGMLSPAIIARIQRLYRKKDLFNGICNELKNVQYSMILQAYLLCSDYGECNKNFLNWCLMQIRKHPEGEKAEEFARNFEMQISLNNEKFSYLKDALKDQNKGKSLKKFNLSFFDLHLADIGHFSVKFQIKLFKLKHNLISLNGEIELAEKYFFMTFDSSLTTENHETITRDLIGRYKFIQKLMVRGIEDISEILEYKKY